MFKPKHYEVPLTPDSVAIQGQPGSFSNMACSAVFKDVSQMHSFDSFAEAFNSIASGKSSAGVIPIENTIAGNVPYVHGLMRSSGLKAVGEYYLPIEHCLMTLPGVNLLDVKTIHSHMHALAQCGGYLTRKSKLFQTKTNADTAGSAKLVSELRDPTQAAIAPALAAQLYGLEISQRGIQDNKSNITKFLVVNKEFVDYPFDPEKRYITTVVVKPERKTEYPLLTILQTLKDNKIHYSCVEEYTGKDFRNEGFYMELVGHRDEKKMKRTLDDLRSFCSGVDIIGLYPTHHYNRFRQVPAASAPVTPSA